MNTYWRVVAALGIAWGSMPHALAATGRAMIQGTTEGSTVTGELVLTDTLDGLRVVAKVQGVAPGRHGFHIHEFGACDEAGQAAGGHYNPGGHPHGDLSAQGVDAVHAGDFGNLEVEVDGTGALDRVYPALTVHGGPYAVAGRAVIVHERPDDFGQPTGNAGGRIGCGPIVITGP